jgi:hypothetical protein
MKKIIFTLLIVFSSHVFGQGKLVFSIDLIRHGDRAPGDQIPTSYIHWKEGLGELTEKGINQEIQLGKQLRIKYIDQYHLLPKVYDANTLYARSTDKNRTIKSADALLLGLYPLNYRKLADQKISVHIVPINDDQLLIVKPSTNVFDIVNRYLKNRNFWKERIAPIENKLNYWSKETKLSLKNIEELDQLADNLYIRKMHQLPLPNGISSEDADAIISLSDSVIVHDFKLKETTDPTGRNFIKAVANYLKLSMQNKTSLKYILFLGHDASIMCVMNTLGSPLEKTPPYASRLNFSLWKNADQYYVKVTFNNQPVVIPGCNKEICSVEQFYKITDSEN